MKPSECECLTQVQQDWLENNLSGPRVAATNPADTLADSFQAWLWKQKIWTEITGMDLSARTVTIIEKPQDCFLAKKLFEAYNITVKD